MPATIKELARAGCLGREDPQQDSTRRAVVHSHQRERRVTAFFAWWTPLKAIASVPSITPKVRNAEVVKATGTDNSTADPM